MPTNNQRYIEIEGAREHNLQDIDVKIPKDRLTVITGLSGSGKSSLAFDTLYAEGQRRYLDTFSNYARQMIGNLEKPDVDHIKGLSPVISIEQKSTGWNPRSTVGTVTELYDFLRLLYARIGEAFSYSTGNRMIRYTEDQIIEAVSQKYEGEEIAILAPVVRGRKGHYREVFEQYRKQGYTKVRVDGEIQELETGMKVDRYKVHDIEIVIDRIRIAEKKNRRMGQSIAQALEVGNGLIFIQRAENGQLITFSKELMDPETGLSYEIPSPNTFSFNSPYGYCPKCKGLGKLYEADIQKIIPDPSLSIGKGGIVPLGEERDNTNFRQLRKLAKSHGFTFATAIDEIPKKALDIILNGSETEWESSRYADIMDWDFRIDLVRDGLVNMINHFYENSSSERLRNWAEQFMHHAICQECDGARLKKEALFFRLAGKNISEVCHFDLEALLKWLNKLPDTLQATQTRIATEIIKELINRTQFLLDVGLNYLTLDRAARTLSGGESQRTRLATQIGSKLTGITYILDEPSIGLHARDNQKLIHALKGLTDMGNTVVVVEHDKEMMESADHLIDMGPGAGRYGGQITAQGSLAQIKNTNSSTIAYLKNKLQIEVPQKRRVGSGDHLILFGASGHNLKNISVNFPLGKFICITGVSGSGKSTLIHDTLYPLLRNHLYQTIKNPLPHQRISGLEHIDKVIQINQKPIGRTPRSNPATYTGVFTGIRQLFTQTPESKIRGYKAGRFSFNVKGGRCEACKGAGKRTIEMNFLPDVLVTCEQCQGKRYNRETLEILYKGKSINDVLELPVSDAVEFFSAIPKIYKQLKTLSDVGLGYITLGQAATTLSGGEAQRVKLAEELSKRDTGRTIYILDEPTTGLHFSDIQYLLKVLNLLADKGNTVIVIEHHMDVIKCADYLIDLGPEGGEGGGRVVAEGRPEEVALVKNSHTGRFLAKELPAQAEVKGNR